MKSIHHILKRMNAPHKPKFVNQKLYKLPGNQKSIRSETEVLVIGGSEYTELAIHALKQNRMSLAGSFDLDIDTPKRRGATLKTISLNSLRNDFGNTPIVIAADPRDLDTYIQYCEKNGLSSAIYDCAELISSFDYGDDTFGFDDRWLYHLVDAYLYEYYRVKEPDYLVVPSIDVVVTEKCSMKCKDCSNLMQYYANPVNADFDRLSGALKKIMNEVDHVLEFRLIGGETFVNRQAHEYLNMLREFDNYSRIAVYTNGTIIPRRENIAHFAKDDVYVRITDYGKHSRNIEGMRSSFDEFGVQHDSRVPEWQDCGTIKRHFRTEEESEKVFEECCVNKTLTLIQDRLYQCPFSGNAHNLGATKLKESEYLDEVASLEDGEIRNRLFGMFRETKFLSACDSCSGRPMDGERNHPVAIQVKVPLTYELSV